MHKIVKNKHWKSNRHIFSFTAVVVFFSRSESKKPNNCVMQGLWKWSCQGKLTDWTNTVLCHFMNFVPCFSCRQKWRISSNKLCHNLWQAQCCWIPGAGLNLKMHRWFYVTMDKRRSNVKSSCNVPKSKADPARRISLKRFNVKLCVLNGWLLQWVVTKQDLINLIKILWRWTSLHRVVTFLACACKLFTNFIQLTCKIDYFKLKIIFWVRYFRQPV